MKFRCHHCNQKIDAPENLQGKRSSCPSCKKSITVPVVSFLVSDVKKKQVGIKKKGSLKLFGIAFVVALVLGGGVLSYIHFRSPLDEQQKKMIYEYLELSAKSEAMTETGMNIVELERSINELSAKFKMLEDVWPEEVAVSAKQDLLRQKEAYSLALVLWKEKNKNKREVIFVRYGSDLDKALRLFTCFDYLDLHKGDDTYTVFYERSIRALFGFASRCSKSARAGLKDKLN